MASVGIFFGSDTGNTEHVAKMIQKELGIIKDDKESDVDEFRARLEKCTVPEAAMKKIDDELHKRLTAILLEYEVLVNMALIHYPSVMDSEQYWSLSLSNPH